MSKFITFFLTLLLLFYLSFPFHNALAHFGATDKNITVVLHVDPNDEPIPKEPATIFLLFGDLTNKFSLEKCKCILTITEGNRGIYSKQLVPKNESKPSVWGIGIPFSFPQRDIYKIKLIGTPLNPNGFQPFSLSWNFRVDQYPIFNPVKFDIKHPLQSKSTQEFIANFIIAVLISAIIFVLLFILFTFFDKKRSK